MRRFSALGSRKPNYPFTTSRTLPMLCYWSARPLLSVRYNKPTKALVAFGGCVIVVSHDRYFLNRVCTSILAFEGARRVAYSVGNYDYYLEKRGTPSPGPDSTPAPAGVADEQTKSKDKPRKLKWKEEREWASMEA